MSRYKLNNPFMTRVGQFEEGKSTLVVGVLESLILSKKVGTLKMTMGNSPTQYHQTFEKLREAKHTVWSNPAGKRVRVIPVSAFIVDESTRPKKKETPPLVDASEVLPPPPPELQASLFQ